MADTTLTALLIGHDKSLSRSMRKASDEVDRTKRKLSDVGKGSEESGRKMGRLGDVASKLGASLGEAFTSVAPKALSNPYVAAAAAVAAASAAVVVGAAAAGAALAGLGLGFVGLGAVALRESQAVKSAATALADDAQSTLARAAKSLEVPFVNAMGTLRGTVRATSGDLATMFGSVAPQVEGLARGLDGFARNAMPGLRNAVAAAAPVLREFGQKLPEIGRAVGRFFDHLAEAGPGAGKAFLFFIDTALVNLELLGKILEHSSKAVQAFADIWNLTLDKFSGGQLGKSLEEIKAMRSAQAALDAQQRSLADSTGNLAGEFDELVSAQQEASDMALRLSGSSDAITRGFQRVSEALKKNHASLTGNSAKSLELRDVIRGSLGDIQAHADLMIKDGANIGQVTAKRDADLRKLRDMLVARGHDKAAVESLISTMLRVPKSVFTKVELSNAERARQQLESVRRAAQAIERAYTLTVGIKGTAAAYATLNQLSARARAGVELRASGGPVRKGMPYIVGERRPELFIPAQNGTIMPRVPTSGGGTPYSGGGPTFNITVHAAAGTDGRRVGADIVRELQQWAKANGPIRGIT